MSSCQDTNLIDELDAPVMLSDKTIATVQPFVESDDYTRAVLTPTTEGLSFAWKKGDKMGVYATNAMASFTLQKLQADGASATFDGGGFALVKGGAYYAFSPYNSAATDQTVVPVTYMSQTQTANNSTTHLSARDYMVAAAVSNDQNEAVFNFAHLGAVLRFQLIVPKAATYTSFSITTKNTNLTTKGTVDITAEKPVITQTSKSKTLTLKLGNSGTGFVVEAENPVLTVYMIVPPVDLSAEMLVLKATTSDGEVFQSSVAGKNIQAGGAYGFAAKHTYVDLGLSVMWATTNVGSNSVIGYGGYYSWGETTEKTDYSWNGYKYCSNGDKNGMTKYGMDDVWGVKDGKNELEDADDVAVVTWGSKWRMPTAQEQVALFNNCYWEWTYNYNNSNIAGFIIYKAKSKEDKGKHSVDSPVLSSTYSLTDTHIFLPAAGSKIANNILYQEGLIGFFWSRSLYDDYAYDGLLMGFRENKAENLKAGTWYYRSTGYSIRPVWVP